MSLPTAYTRLESLLLFQALRSEGVNSYTTFNRISEQLNNIPLVRNDPTYDSRRLSPDALQEWYLWLLKEETKKDVEKQLEKENGTNGNVSPGSRKRKAPSPDLPTVQEASQHSHLIPQLVGRLYALYRESVVREIREHERRYDALSGELIEIEAGKWDEKLQRQKSASAGQSPVPFISAYTQATEKNEDHVKPVTSTPASPSLSKKTPEGSGEVPPKRYSENKIDAVINHGPDSQNGTSDLQRTSSNTTLPPLSEMKTKSPHFGLPPKIPGPGLHPSYNDYSPGGHQPSLASHYATSVTNQLSSSQVQQSLPRPSSSPRPILPPPPGMQLSAPASTPLSMSPSLHGTPVAPQQNFPPSARRLLTGQSPTNDPTHRGPVPPLLPPSLPGYYPPQRQEHPPAQYVTQTPPSGGYQPPPFSIDQQAPAQPQPNPMFIPPQHTPVPQTLQTLIHHPNPRSQWPSSPVTLQRQQSRSRLVADILNSLGTTPRTTPTVTRWKSERRPPHLKVGTSLPSPSSEPLSPIQRRTEPSTRSTRSIRSTRNRDTEPTEAELVLRPSRRRGRAKRDRTPHSVVSSTADESTRITRSHSVSTVAGAALASDDRPESRGNVKVEPSTPAAFDDAEVVNEPPTASAGGRMTRKRRSTLQTMTQSPFKRSKRQQSPSAAAEMASEAAGTPSPRPSTILATRNFHKLSSTIMNDINSHKHASYFANMVRDKDAPGYSEIIKQPQHLKSIRMAITAGSRAVTAAASALESPSSTDTPAASIFRAADGSTTVELERRPDLVPPKAIVNAAQLEKEITRMLANAVMFNPGEDGMVSDTREMFEDVDAKIRDWRGADREVGDVASTADAVAEDEGKGKRRKL